MFHDKISHIYDAIIEKQGKFSLKNVKKNHTYVRLLGLKVTETQIK